MAKCVKVTPEVEVRDDQLFSTHSREQPCAESWIEVGQQAEGTLTHNHSEEEFEKLLAAAVVEEDTDVVPQGPPPMPNPVFQLASEPSSQQEEGEGREETEGQPITLNTHKEKQLLVANEASHIHRMGVRSLSIRGTALMKGDCFQQLLPVLLVSHLAIFGLGLYLGRRSSFVQTY